MSRLLWARCDLPVRMALFGSFMCKFMASSPATAWGQSRIRVRATELESWATGVLDACPSRTGAFDVLSRPTNVAAHTTLLDLAMVLQMKQFLAHRYCQSMMQVWCLSRD